VQTISFRRPEQVLSSAHNREDIQFYHRGSVQIVRVYLGVSNQSVYRMSNSSVRILKQLIPRQTASLYCYYFFIVCSNLIQLSKHMFFISKYQFFHWLTILTTVWSVGITSRVQLFNYCSPKKETKFCYYMWVYY